jgi:hypothetical protein
MSDVHSELAKANAMVQTGLITSDDYDALRSGILGKFLGGLG